MERIDYYCFHKLINLAYDETDFLTFYIIKNTSVYVNSKVAYYKN